MPNKLIARTVRNCVIFNGHSSIEVHQLPRDCSKVIRFRFKDKVVTKFLVSFGFEDQFLAICAEDGPITAARIYLTIQVFPGDSKTLH